MSAVASLTCPSAPPGAEGAQVLGVVAGGPDEPRIAYLNAHLPVSEVLLASSGEVPPMRVMRIAGRCEQEKCTHFGAGACKLAERIVESLPEVVDSLPPCVIRRTCRWFAQEGRAACLRCPQIVTLAPVRTDEMRRVAFGSAGPAAG